LIVSVTLDDFVAYLPDHSYIFMPTGAFWSAAGVNASIRPIPVLNRKGKPVKIKDGPNKGEPKKVSATGYLDRNRPVHHLTWAPGHPVLIKNCLIREEDWVKRMGVTTFNFYHPPTVKPGDPKKAGLWLDLIHKVYPNECKGYPNDGQRLINFFAHRVQRPQEKINHGILMGGKPGIGKDTIAEPVKRAVGSWNFSEVSPAMILGRFNGFRKAVIMRVSEVRDLGDFNRYQFYESTKVLLAAPPNTLPVDEKNIPAHLVMNCVGVIFTTNHLTDGIYLPPDDRRHDVLWSDLTVADFEEGYWKKIYNWYDNGGDAHVAAYLRTLDISAFDPKEPPPKTAAFWSIVDANRAPEEGELQDVLDQLGNPDAVTLEEVTDAASFNPATGYHVLDSDFQKWLKDRKNRRAIPHRFEKANYVPVRNEGRGTGLWVIGGVRQVVYAKGTLTVSDRIKAVTALQHKVTEAAKKKKKEKEEEEKAKEKKAKTAETKGKTNSKTKTATQTDTRRPVGVKF
jgi:hypothetical protein